MTNNFYMTITFQSTLSMRRATWWDGERLRVFKFQSTLSMRRATYQSDSAKQRGIISIHALHEESDYRDTLTVLGYVQISIHALHEESDGVTDTASGAAFLFQSTLSMRRATVPVHPTATIHLISIHALHEESDLRGSTAPCVARRFQSTLSMRRATDHDGIVHTVEVFQSTLSMRRATV